MTLIRLLLIKLPQILIGALISSKTGWDKNISFAFIQSHFISGSVSGTVLITVFNLKYIKNLQFTFLLRVFCQ